MGERDPRCLEELAAVFFAQSESGFVPHMRYLHQPSYRCGPRRDASSLTQPPVYGLVLERLHAAGWQLPDELISSAMTGIGYLWSHRRTEEGLLAIFHPWESGADDSPRWDAWIGTSSWNQARFSAVDRFLLRRTHFDSEAAACGSSAFVSCPAGFNSITAYAAACLGRLTGADAPRHIALQLSAAIDGSLWNEHEGLWDDLAKVGPGSSQAIPTLDGVLGALVTEDERRAMRALDQVLDPDRFGATYGVRYVPPKHPAYEPDAYWRGPAWPQMNYLVWLAAHRWNRLDVALLVQSASWRAAKSSSLAEYWNPETGAGRGAVPQTWATVVTAMTDDHAPEPERG
ncbi:MAG TPA: hypothetical protein VK988_10655 [Acidimicrobiales bacterium]|nr:hypothetical protein [Acidimicrobiales bacterium]